MKPGADIENPRGDPDELDHPDFDKCANCGAQARQYVYWNPTGGWTCLECGASDLQEAAE